ncbi:MAG: hypothetical protein COA97_07630 [Flavobacteriales bacterium]|nr:MAG: hypothetical protein COA97_07630 [Flavobacteriales bacterium]
MFTSGQQLFALFFITVFVIAIGYQFYQDHKKNKALFKGTYLVLIAVIVLMVGYVLLNKAFR